MTETPYDPNSLASIMRYTFDQEYVDYPTLVNLRQKILAAYNAQFKKRKKEQIVEVNKIALAVLKRLEKGEAVGKILSMSNNTLIKEGWQDGES